MTRHFRVDTHHPRPGEIDHHIPKLPALRLEALRCFRLPWLLQINGRRSQLLIRQSYL